ncbi:MarR family transcriptional regulator [Rhodobacterales bacterium HKCCE2091]|nr:MarR family transcriptional regulator [Rhodobacterales bacterium HKCCE2091]
MTTTDAETPDDLSDMISYQIRLIQIAAYKNFESRTRGFGSAPRYFGLLRIIEANPGSSQSRLAEAVCLDRSSLVPILEALEAEGIVERRASTSDRRVRRVFLTTAGRKLLGDLRSRVERHEEDLVAGLPGPERAQLAGLLQRLSANMRGTGAGRAEDAA